MTKSKSVTKALVGQPDGRVVKLLNGASIHKNGDSFAVHKDGKIEYECTLYGTALMVAEAL